MFCVECLPFLLTPSSFLPINIIINILINIISITIINILIIIILVIILILTTTFPIRIRNPYNLSTIGDDGSRQCRSGAAIFIRLL